MQRTFLFIFALLALGLAGCSSVGSGAPPPAVAAPAEPAAPTIPTGAALGGVLGGAIGASLNDSDRQTAWEAQVAALDFGPAALVARLAWRVRLRGGRRRDRRRLPRLFANHLYRRPAQPRPWRRLQTAGRKLEDDELRF